jgi:type VI secretion system protein ImpA
LIHPRDPGTPGRADRMAVLDVATFLEPIRPDQPSGPELKYNTDPAVAAAKKLYDECEEARRSDEDSANVGAWKRDVKVADWRKASELAQTLLKSHTKDLQVTAWMIEALTHRQGLDGLHDGLQVFQALLETFWETIHPQPDPDDGSLYYREGVYESLDAERILPLLIRKLP